MLNMLLPAYFITLSQSAIIDTWKKCMNTKVWFSFLCNCFFSDAYFSLLLFLKLTLAMFCHKPKCIHGLGRYAKWAKQATYKTIWSGDASSERGKGKISLIEWHLKRERESKKIKTLFKQNQNIFAGKFLIFHSALMIIWNRDFHGMDSVSATTRDYPILTRGLSIKNRRHETWQASGEGKKAEREWCWGEARTRTGLTTRIWFQSWPLICL